MCESWRMGAPRRPNRCALEELVQGPFVHYTVYLRPTARTFFHGGEIPLEMFFLHAEISNHKQETHIHVGICVSTSTTYGRISKGNKSESHKFKFNSCVNFTILHFNPCNIPSTTSARTYLRSGEDFIWSEVSTSVQC